MRRHRRNFSAALFKLMLLLLRYYYYSLNGLVGICRLGRGS